MAYISNKLCHFVGRSLKNDRERVELLLKIINSGQLLANPLQPDGQPTIETNSSYKRINDLGEPFSRIDCVCFCDIPDSELSIHIQKYSKVGLAFSKEFLIKAGARPVHYIPLSFDMSLQMKDCIISKEPATYYVDIGRLTYHFMLLLTALNQEDNDIVRMYITKEKTSELVKQVSRLIELNLPELFSGNPLQSITYTISRHVLNSNAYVKIFNPALEDNDPNNYYMEREWRTLQNVAFSVDDIKSIYLPKNIELRDAFVEKFPNLEGKIIII